MIKGKKVTLRPLMSGDRKMTLKWRNDLVIKKMAMMHPFPVTDVNEKGWYDDLLGSKNDKTVFFAIENKKKETVGFISLNNINRTNRNCYLSIVIGDEKNQGKGYGKDAIATILTYAFSILNLRKVSLEVLKINNKALNLYKVSGFVEEGRLKEHFFFEGKYHDVVIMSFFNSKKIKESA